MDKDTKRGFHIIGLVMIVAVLLAWSVAHVAYTRNNDSFILKYQDAAVERGYAEWVLLPGNPRKNVWQWIEPEEAEAEEEQIHE